MKNIVTAFIISGISTLAFSQTLVRDINPGLGASSPYIFATLPGNKTIFSAYDGVNGIELWVTDGTSPGTKMIKNVNPSNSTSPSPMYNLGSVVMNGKLYYGFNDGVYGMELWETDGTEAGTKMVKDIYPGSGNGFVGSQIIEFNGKMYFSGTDDVSGAELWTSDGTAAGTVKVLDINPGVNSSNPFYYKVFKNRLYFAANNGTNGFEWWSSDGTAGGTSIFYDLNPGASGSISTYCVEYNGSLYFAGYADNINGIELYRIEGDSIGLVKNIAQTGGQSSSPNDFITAGGLLFFRANDNVNGSELWRTDGTDSGTVLVKDITPGNTGTSLFLLGELNGKLIFTATTSLLGKELWISDGTGAGTLNLKDLNIGSGNGVVNLTSEMYPKPEYNFFVNPYIYNGLYYFAGYSGPNLIELWQTDGTVSGTKKADSTTGGTGYFSTNWIYVNNGNVWLNANDGTAGFELYRYKVTTGSLTKPVKQSVTIYPNPASGEIRFSRSGLVTIYDLHGRVHLSCIAEGSDTDVSGLSPGMYTVTVKDENGLYSGKLIIE